MKTSLIGKVFSLAAAAFAATLAFAEPTGPESGSNASLYKVDSATGSISFNEGASAFSFNASGLGEGQSVQYVLYHRVQSAGDLEAREPVRGEVVPMTSIGVKEGDSLYFMLNSSLQSAAFTQVDGDYVVHFDPTDVGGKTITISNLKASGGGAPSGQPLPGLLAILLVGGAGAGALKLRKRRS